MATFFTSDLHFGHTNIILYCDRPFLGADQSPDTAAQSEAIVARWRATVAPEDDVWILGDLAMGRIEESLEVVSQLTGRLRLVPGNHDRCWVGQRKGAQRWADRYRDAGIAEIVDHPQPLRVAGHSVELNHFPYTGDSGSEDRYVDHRPTDRGSWLLCGHVHDAWRQRHRQINVGIDAWGGNLVSLEQVGELIAAGPADRGPIPWTS